MEALPPASGAEPEPDRTDEEFEFIEFNERWERASELHSVAGRLPGQVVLKSGLSGQRNRLLERWDALETPGLDGSLPEGALEALNKWVHDAEVLIAYIIKIGRDGYQVREDRKVYSGPPVDPEDLPQVISSLDELDWVHDDWCWPWVERVPATIEKPRWDKGKLIKMGAVGALGIMALVTYLDEE